MSFGIRTVSAFEPLVAKALDLAMEFMDLTGWCLANNGFVGTHSTLLGPWSNCVDFFEFLQYLPSNKRTRGRKLHDDLIEVYGGMLLDFKARMLSGEEVPDCLVKTLLDNQDTEKLDWEDLCMLSAVFTLGGVHSVRYSMITDTFPVLIDSFHVMHQTSGIIQWFLALIPSHRDALARAQKELDEVIGHTRWPTFDDECNLPFTRAIIKEVRIFLTLVFVALI